MFVKVFLGAGKDGLLTPQSGSQEALVELFHAMQDVGAVAAVRTRGITHK